LIHDAFLERLVSVIDDLLAQGRKYVLLARSGDVTWR